MFNAYQLKIARDIYDQLGEVTASTNSRIVIRPWFGRKGVEKAKEEGIIFTLRVPGMRFHLGNPFTPVRALAERDGLIHVETVKDAVIHFVAWVLWDSGERATQIRDWLASGIMKGKPLAYYRELKEPSHATALEWLIDRWDEIGKLY